jgi:drug/metabolite transporter (DMT)-like permease
MEWTLLMGTSLIWGSSFLWIAVALRDLEPGVVALLRLVLGAAALSVIPAARRPVQRRDWPRILLIAVAGNAGPALLFAVAQQTVDSSVAGMINSGVPILTLAMTVMLTRLAPGRLQVVGLIVGFGGILAMALPNLSGADAAPLGIGLLLLAITGYAITNNVMVPIQQQYGSLPVVARSLWVGVVLMLPAGAFGLAESRVTWRAAGAMAILGVAGTGFARSLQASLVGRAGAARASLVAYLIPVVAILLGVVVLSERVSALELIGVGLVLAGAFLASRRERAPAEVVGRRPAT